MPDAMTPIYQHTLIDGLERSWAVDDRAAAKVMPWVKRSPEVFRRDLSGMADYFPHWFLAGGANEKPLPCQRCGALQTPFEGAVRCLKCKRPGQATGLVWVGHLPVLARPEAAFVARQQVLREAGFAEATAGEAAYLLVPLTVHYPAEWPNLEPVARYAGRWLDALGLPRSSAAHHLIQNGRACIFDWGQWQAMPIHAVLQQRLVNHLASLFKIVAGQRPAEAFIGRVHSLPWQPG